MPSSQSSFGSRYSAVVNAMNSATGAWESAARVNFVHNVSADGNCTKNTNSVVFNVRQVCTGQYLARAFFPSTSRRGREILIDCTSFGNISPWSLNGVLRHELGHTIGFRHEHTRPESGTCFENNSWAALTTYDLALEAGDRRLRAICTGNIGALRHDVRDYDAAEERYEEALATLRACGDTRTEGVFLTNLAVLHQEVERFDRARTGYKRGIEVKSPSASSNGPPKTGTCEERDIHS